MNRGTRAQTRPSAITTISAALTVPAIIRTALSPGTGVWIGEAAIVLGVGVRTAVRIAGVGGETNGMSDGGVR